MNSSSYSFFCFGHQNIKGTHAKTFEFTKDDYVTERGDCIIGVKADFSISKLKNFIKDKDKLRVLIECDESMEEVNCELNTGFNDDHEIVIRKSEFDSGRTLGVRADKACSDMDRIFIEKLANNEAEIKVTLLKI